MKTRIAATPKPALCALVMAGWLGATPAAGQLAIEATSVPVSMEFTGFTGLGFTPTPAAGQLDSGVLSVAGLSEGDLPFGTTAEFGDFARGVTTGGVSTGGVYAFDLGNGDTALGFQPTSSDYSPGSLTLRLRNDADVPLEKILVVYDIVVYNDQGRGSRWNLSFAGEELGPYEDVPAADFASPTIADSTPAYALTARSVELLPPAIAPGELFYLRWTSDDDAGAGSRDEIGIDNISIVGESLTPGSDLLFDDGFESGDVLRWSDWLQ